MDAKLLMARILYRIRWFPEMIAVCHGIKSVETWEAAERMATH